MQEVFSTPTVTVKIDKANGIIEVMWKGLVSATDLEETLKILKEKLFDNTNMIVNRSQLIDFDSDARRWIINVLMKKEAKTLVPYFSTLSTIESTAKIRMFTVAINQLGSFIFPNLIMESFTSREDALNWIEKIKAERIQNPDKNRSSFVKRVIAKLFGS